MADSPNLNGTVFATLLNDQLIDERRRLDSRRERAAGVVTSSVASVAFLFTLAGFALGGGKITFNTGERIALLVADGCLLLAALIGAVVAFRSVPTAVVSDRTLSTWLAESGKKEVKPSPPEEVVRIIKSARQQNRGWESYAVNIALALEALALVASACALASIILRY
jgi:hypothetical protein